MKTDSGVLLDDVLGRVGLDAPLTGVTVSGISHDNRSVAAGFVFAALPGFRRHGAEFAAAAVSAGAVAVMTDADGAQMLADLPVPVIVSANPRSDMAQLARWIHGDAQAKLISVGITGTNGKTTTTYLVEAGLVAAGFDPLLIGTTGVRFRGELTPAARTTPESTDLHALIDTSQRAGARSLVMEVSSHALVLHRVGGVHFDVGVFTNLSPDHLDFHHSMTEYFEAKSRLFDQCSRAVIDIDGEWGQKLAHQVRIPTLTVGLSAGCHWRAHSIEYGADGMTSFIATGPASEHRVEIALPGDFNVSNAIAAIAVFDLLELPLELVIPALASVRVAGRFESVADGADFLAFVDYAHTPDAVERVLGVARLHARGRVITVLGCGGDRDSAKRGPMGRAAALLSDVVIVTDDNPRSETPADIRAAVLAGARTAAASTTTIDEIGDRAAAIDAAIGLARSGDVVMVLGKGHEVGQEVAGVVSHFDDREQVRSAVARRLS